MTVPNETRMIVRLGRALKPGEFRIRLFLLRMREVEVRMHTHTHTHTLHIACTYVHMYIYAYIHTFMHECAQANQLHLSIFTAHKLSMNIDM